MKRWLFLLLCVGVILGLAACTPTPKSTVPDAPYDLAYDMCEHNFFSEIFDEKPVEEWNAMAQYTILLNGFETPVWVDMNGMDVLSVRAYGQTVELGADGCVFQGSTPVEIDAAADAILVNISWDYDGKTHILTEDRCYTFQPEGSISTQVFVKEDGTLTYRRYWGEYLTSLNQWDYAPLDLCTSRDHFLHEYGSVQLQNAEAILTLERRVTVSDEYDLDALFSQAKAAGLYEDFDTVDALLAANKAKASE